MSRFVDSSRFDEIRRRKRRRRRSAARPAKRRPPPPTYSPLARSSLIVPYFFSRSAFCVLSALYCRETTDSTVGCRDRTAVPLDARTDWPVWRGIPRAGRDFRLLTDYMYVIYLKVPLIGASCPCHAPLTPCKPHECRREILTLGEGFNTQVIGVSTDSGVMRHL